MNCYLLRWATAKISVVDPLPPLKKIAKQVKNKTFRSFLEGTLHITWHLTFCWCWSDLSNFTKLHPTSSSLNSTFSSFARGETGVHLFLSVLMKRKYSHVYSEGEDRLGLLYRLASCKPTPSAAAITLKASTSRSFHRQSSTESYLERE